MLPSTPGPNGSKPGSPDPSGGGSARKSGADGDNDDDNDDAEAPAPADAEAAREGEGEEGGDEIKDAAMEELEAELEELDPFAEPDFMSEDRVEAMRILSQYAHVLLLTPTGPSH